MLEEKWVWLEVASLVLKDFLDVLDMLATSVGDNTTKYMQYQGHLNSSHFLLGEQWVWLEVEASLVLKDVLGVLATSVGDDHH